MVPTSILLMYLVAVVFALVAVLFYFSIQRQPQVNITIVCGQEMEAKALRKGVVNGSGLLIRCENGAGDLINLGLELPAGMKLRLVRA